jgi:hypothetical protein
MSNNDDLLNKAKAFFPDIVQMVMGEEEAQEEQNPREEIKPLSPEQRLAIQTSPTFSNWGDKDAELDIAAAMQSAKDPLTGLLRDLKIDDRDLPLAKNYYEFCSKTLGYDFMPWPRQMWAALILFAEVCPRCSDPKWYRNVLQVPKRPPTSALLDHLQLLEYGVCPKCKANKYQLYTQGEIRLYNELVLVWGQRCVTAETLVPTELGLLRMDEIATLSGLNTRNFVFGSTQKIPKVHDGVGLVTPSAFFSVPEEPIYNIILSNGAAIRGTADHPIYIPAHDNQEAAFVKLRDVCVGMPVDTFINTRCFGNGVLNLQNRDEPTLQQLRLACEDDQLEYYKKYSDKDGVFVCLLESDLHEHLAILGNLGYRTSIVSDRTICVEDRLPHTNVEVVRQKVVLVTQHQPEVTYDFTIPVAHQFVSNTVMSHNSGKSTSAAMMAAYHIHRFLKLPRLGTMIDTVQNSTPLTYSFISLSAEKAVQLLWEPLVEVIKDSRWYQDLFKLLDHYGRKYGVELYNRKLEFIKFYHKNIHLVPTHPGWEKLRGATRIGASFDELGLFPLPEIAVNELDLEGEVQLINDKRMANADQAHQSVNTSLITVRNATAQLLSQGLYHVPTGIMLGVSSPVNHRDMVMRLLAKSQTEEGSKTMLGLQLPTWEVHPTLDRDSPEIMASYAKNPEDAERDLAANPPRIQSSYITLNNLKDDVFIGGRNSHLVDYDYSGGFISANVRKAVTTNNASILSIDSGYTDNSFALCSQYYDFKTGKTVCTTVLEIIPSGGMRINFNEIYKNIILPVARDTNAAIVVADRWNSLDLLYRISADIPGVIAKQFTPGRRHFNAAKTMLQEGNVIFPSLEIPLTDVAEAVFDNYRKFFINKPVAHLAHQMLTVRDTHANRPPEKGEGFTDDIFRAWTLGASIVHLPRMQKILSEAQLRIKTNGNKNPGAVYVQRGAMF